MRRRCLQQCVRGTTDADIGPQALLACGASTQPLPINVHRCAIPSPKATALALGVRTEAIGRKGVRPHPAQRRPFPPPAAVGSNLARQGLTADDLVTIPSNASAARLR